jgi:predicted RNase H-like HicB family nuclease
MKEYTEELRIQLETIIDTYYEICFTESQEEQSSIIETEDFAERIAEYVADNHEELEGIDIVTKTIEYINENGEAIIEGMSDTMTEEENLRYEHPIN